MSEKPSLLEQTRQQLRQLAEEAKLLEAHISVTAKTLTAEEAIGKPERQDFPIVVGKESMIEARVADARGQAFTDSPQEFTGSLDEVLHLELASNQKRAVYVAALNAVLAHLGRVEGTVHCRDEDPELCAREIAAELFEEYGPVKVGLIGLNPAIAEQLAERFGPDRLGISDLFEGNIGRQRFDTEVWDGSTRNSELVDASDLVLVTGTTLVNGALDSILERLHDGRGTAHRIYGVTGAGACALLGLPRICPYGRSGRP